MTTAPDNTNFKGSAAEASIDFGAGSTDASAIIGLGTPLKGLPSFFNKSTNNTSTMLVSNFNTPAVNRIRNQHLPQQRHQQQITQSKTPLPAGFNFTEADISAISMNGSLDQRDFFAEVEDEEETNEAISRKPRVSPGPFHPQRSPQKKRNSFGSATPSKPPFNANSMNDLSKSRKSLDSARLPALDNSMAMSSPFAANLIGQMKAVSMDSMFVDTPARGADRFQFDILQENFNSSFASSSGTPTAPSTTNASAVAAATPAAAKGNRQVRGNGSAPLFVDTTMKKDEQPKSEAKDNLDSAVQLTTRNTIADKDTPAKDVFDSEMTSEAGTGKSTEKMKGKFSELGLRERAKVGEHLFLFLVC